MILSEGTIRFTRRHADRVIEDSKTAIISSFSLLVYEFMFVLLVIIFLIYSSTNPSDLAEMVSSVVTESPVQIALIALFTLAVYKINLLETLSLFDPHDYHPILDTLISLPLIYIGAKGLNVVLGPIQNYSPMTEGLDAILDHIIFFGMISVAMVSVTIILNGACRLIYHVLGGLLLLLKIKQLPDIIHNWAWENVKIVRDLTAAKRTVIWYANSKDESPFTAIRQIFNTGINQFDPQERESTDEVEDGRGNSNGNHDNDVIVSHQDGA